MTALSTKQDDTPPIRFALRNKNEHMIDLLIDHGADVNASDKEVRVLSFSFRGLLKSID